MKRIGFVVNPIAGMGGKVGLKGTDHVVAEAIALGARPSSSHKAIETLETVCALLEQEQIRTKWISCSGAIGADSLAAAGCKDVEIVYEGNHETGAGDTRAAVKRFMKYEVDLVLFCGGDGTARDICSVTRQTIPILGIPAGVKMYSGIFGTNPIRTAEILISFLQDRLTVAAADILDLDENKYRQGQWVVRLYDVALVPIEPTYTQLAKTVIAGGSDAQIKQDIASELCKQILSAPQTLFVLGPGSTVTTIGQQLGINKTLLGVDAVCGAKLIGKDLNESKLLTLIDQYKTHKLVLSPIGAQGFVLGRGNLQLSAEVVCRTGTDNLLIVATPGKLDRTKALRFDTGDAALDQEFAAKAYLPVITGHHQRRLIKVII